GGPGERARHPSAPGPVAAGLSRGASTPGPPDGAARGGAARQLRRRLHRVPVRRRRLASGLPGAAALRPPPVLHDTRRAARIRRSPPVTNEHELTPPAGPLYPLRVAR